MAVFHRNVAVAIVYKKEGKETDFLVAENTFGKFVFPGGGMRKREGVEQAALRELEEELGVRRMHIESARPLEATEVLERRYWFFTIREKVRFCAVKLWETPEFHRNWEIRNTQWLPFHEALETLSHDALKNGLKQYYKENYFL